MPLVKPRDKEKRKDFLERCMGDQTSVDDFPDRSQRFAVCNGLYNDKKEEAWEWGSWAPNASKLSSGSFLGALPGQDFKMLQN